MTQYPLFAPSHHRQGLIDHIDKSIAILQWDESECRDYLKAMYNGRSSRWQLADLELEHLARQLEKAARIVSQ